MSTKVRKTLTLDADVVEAFGKDASALSATVNATLTAELDRRADRAALAALVAKLDAEFGEPEPSDLDRFRRALT